MSVQVIFAMGITGPCVSLLQRYFYDHWVLKILWDLQKRDGRTDFMRGHFGIIVYYGEICKWEQAKGFLHPLPRNHAQILGMMDLRRSDASVLQIVHCLITQIDLFKKLYIKAAAVAYAYIILQKTIPVNSVQLIIFRAMCFLICDVGNPCKW